jgi:hypothetical protein
MRLIDADKAKEKLRVNAQNDGSPFVGVIVETFCEFLDQTPTVEDAEERGESGRVPRWIPVTERLPENTEDVLVYRPKMKIEIGITCRINDEWLRYGKDLHGNDVITHWMPLPSAPEVE